MKKNIINKFILVFCIYASTLTSAAQQVNTMYFVENVPVRNYLNPAFQPLSNFYFGMPILGYSQFSLGNNSITLKDLLYNDSNGKTMWGLNSVGGKDKYYNLLNSTTLLQTNIQLNLLDFGFRTGKAYWSFSLTEKVEGQFGMPKDLMKLMLYGTPDINQNLYNFQSYGFDMTAYTEAGLGYSRVINDKLSIGGKIKFLYGTFNASMTNTNLDMSANIDQWTVKGKGVLKTSSADIVEGNTAQTLSLTMPSKKTDFTKPAGLGAGVDLGVTYKPISALTLSAALTDLGMIHWTKNTKVIDYSVDYTYTGLKNLNLNTDFNDIGKLISDSILTPLKNSASSDIKNNQYNTFTSAKLNLGAEYGFFDNKLSLGLLSRTMKHNSNLFEELTASVNGRPIDWFNLSASYSILNGRMSNIGAGLGIRTGFIHWFVSTDYVPLAYTQPFPIVDNGSSSFKLPIPYNTKGLNLAFGVNLVFGNRKDADKDGVVDRKDKCPDTPLGVKVDKKGCPIDSDGDGVPDYLDKCPNTPPEAYGSIDKDGCPLDTDSDGVADYLEDQIHTVKRLKGGKLKVPLTL